MRKHLTRYSVLALCVLLTVSLLAMGVLAAEEPLISRNIYKQDYDIRSQPVTSSLIREGDGYLRAEYAGDSLLVAESYDGDLNFVSRRDITLPLPLYGGVYICADANFVVCGQENGDEDDTKEVVRIIRYTKDWEEVAHTSVYGANTTIPFRSGSLRFARAGDILYVRTSHQMYTNASDGLRHQANMTFRVRITDMALLNSFHQVANSSVGYVSHSFNQFVLVDGDDFLAVDHGDAYPRSVVLFRTAGYAASEYFPSRTSKIDVMPISGEIGANITETSVGGFEYSSTHYLVAGESMDHTGASGSGWHNIFVTATPKNDFSESATKLTWLTDYPDETGNACSTPHLVKIDTDQFFLGWNVGETLHYCFLDGTGAVISEMYSTQADLSDCKPIVSGDELIWYVTWDTYPIFYRLDLNDPTSIAMVHRHTRGNATITTESQEDTPGQAEAVCFVCGDVEEIILPPISSGAYELEYTGWLDCPHGGTESVTWKDTTYGTLSFTRSVADMGCSYGDWIVLAEPDCTTEGNKVKTCSRCGFSATEKIPALGHSWGGEVFGDGCVTRTCGVCGTVETKDLNPEVTRIYGATRYETAFKAADELLESLGKTKFDCIIVACGTNFPDALSGTYLAAQRNAPILLVNSKNVKQVNQYIRDHLNYGGRIYLLGDERVVPTEVCYSNLNALVMRLGGATRYDTNLAILREAGVGSQEILICTGENFADSLSVSAVGKPILLVKNKLTEEQKAFLRVTSGQKIIIGGTGAVSERVENQLKEFGEVKRIGGKTRYETSVLVAETFFDEPEYAVLAYAQNFPDGLSGGPLAHSLKAPLILTATGKQAAAEGYMVPRYVVKGYVLGGPTLIRDNTVRKVFSMEAEDAISVR